MPRDHLRGVERFAVPLLDALNSQRAVKAAVQWFGRQVSARWVRACTRNLVTIEGLDALRGLAPANGVILVSNHRSFFDMYVVSAFLYENVSFIERLYFPVRSNFFYDHPLGVLVNLAISGGAMWPPVFRDDRRGALNPVGLDQIAHVLTTPGAVVGIHPEGTRGKGPDPYTYLPARSGLGEIVLAVPEGVVIVPLFVIGLKNAFGRQVLSNFGFGPADPVRVRFGASLTVGEARRLGVDAASVSRALFARVEALGELDRATVAAREG
ncbi:MAG: lysophospholipid acyltransferase family protein [Pseudomonadota bacterium]|nr:lysophospholipid acyltransferase family protein [Pseudomonadota bacterium]